MPLVWATVVQRVGTDIEFVVGKQAVFKPRVFRVALGKHFARVFGPVPNLQIVYMAFQPPEIFGKGIFVAPYFKDRRVGYVTDARVHPDLREPVHIKDEAASFVFDRREVVSRIVVEPVPGDDFRPARGACRFSEIEAESAVAPDFKGDVGIEACNILKSHEEDLWRARWQAFEPTLDGESSPMTPVQVGNAP